MGNQAEEKDMNQNEEIASENTAEVADNLPESSAENAKNVKEDQTDTAKLQGEIAEQKDKYIRLYSEFENFRRRTAKEKLEMIQSANEQLLKALLPVVDDFERAEKSFKDKDSKELEGFFLIYNKFKKTLDQYGVKTMEAGAGSEFNPDLHEAITQIPAPDEKLKGKIVDVVEKGYLLNEKVIRFAKVVVGS
ncbi:nucleotide exchange factor GrpE [Ohtaekwangia kribbensis]|jgi:molecular chaperone GrpE|uniref:Protein GrpE n=1 Tax=Ohtaekwangia kribbensis TaxID=688913 RepID=A0ABW3K303_9BACT